MENGPLYIAFYGTLKAGTEQFQKLGLDKHLKFASECEIRGDIYDIENPATNENYPAFIEGAGTIKAQLFEIRDTSFFPAMDKYEECDEANPEKALYVRKPVLLQKPAVDAWVYVFNQSVEGRAKIEGGDWTAHLAAKKVRRAAVPSGPQFGT